VKIKDLIKRLLEPDPEKRLGSGKVRFSNLLDRVLRCNESLMVLRGGLGHGVLKADPSPLAAQCGGQI